MPDLEPLTFKASADLRDALCREMGRHDLNRSEFLRQCIRIATPILRVCPALLEADDYRIADIMETVGKMTVLLLEREMNHGKQQNAI